MAVAIIPALVWVEALLTRLDHDFIWLLLPPIQIPDMVVDPVVVALSLRSYVRRDKWVFFIRTMDDDEHSADFHLAPREDVILESCVFDELLRNCRRVFDRMSFADKTLCKMLLKAVSKKSPEKCEVWERALLEAGFNKYNWTDKSYLKPILESLRSYM